MAKRVFSMAAIALMSLGIITPAHAEIFKITFDGHVINGTDYAGLFEEPPGSSLTNDTYSEVFYINTHVGHIQSDTLDGTQIKGGVELGTDSPVSASLELNGVVHYVNSEYYGFANEFNNDGQHGPFNGKPLKGQTFAEAEGRYQLNGGPVIDLLVNAFNSYALDDGAPNIFGQPFSVKLNGATIGKDTFGDAGARFYIGVPYPTYQFGSGAPGGASGSLALASVSSSVISTAPEPAAWAMLLAGFGLTGAGFRRRRMIAI